jgi:hypothetical protein
VEADDYVAEDSDVCVARTPEKPIERDLVFENYSSLFDLLLFLFPLQSSLLNRSSLSLNLPKIFNAHCPCTNRTPHTPENRKPIVNRPEENSPASFPIPTPSVLSRFVRTGAISAGIPANGESNLFIPPPPNVCFSSSKFVGSAAIEEGSGGACEGV